MALPDFDDDNCWIHVAGSTEIACGDVYAGVPLLRLDDRFRLLRLEARFFFPVTFSVGIIVSTEPHCVVVPVTTQNNVSDEQRFKGLVELARGAPTFCRLPEVPGLWEGSAIAALIQPTALPHHLFATPPPERFAAMTDEAKAVLKERYVASVAH